MSVPTIDCFSSRLENHTRVHWSPSIGIPRMTSVSLFKSTESNVRTTESYEVFRLGHHLDSTVTGTEQNGPNYRIGPDTSYGTRPRAVHSCNSRFETEL